MEALLLPHQQIPKPSQRCRYAYIYSSCRLYLQIKYHFFCIWQKKELEKNVSKKKKNTVRQWLVTKSGFPPQVSHFPSGLPLAVCVTPTPDARTQEAVGWVNTLTGASHALLPSPLLFLLLAEAGQPPTCPQPQKGSQNHFHPTHLTPFPIPNCKMMLRTHPEDAFHWTKLWTLAECCN